MEDIQIARSIKPLDILDVAKKLKINPNDVICYGNNKAKLKINYGDKNGKLILVTAINPTPYGEGKTTVSIGLNDALCKLNKNSLAVLRQPSMGPVFGMKGGATGGGYSQIIPMDEINLHFTGDFHAITSANNLLCAAIDNHIFQGNELGFDKVVFNRCLDVNDRALRSVNLNNRQEKFNITAASEIMALFCLADSIEDLERRLGNIIVGYDVNNHEIYAKNLDIEGALTVILKDAFLPNIVQTLEGNLVIVHGGPFANIAHGCNSLIATKYGLSIADYVVTEAGFGADLGAEKFFDIKCKVGDLKPDAVVLVVTIKALKYNASVMKEHILEENIEAVKIGLSNLDAHVNNLRKFGVSIVVCLNKFDTDKEAEIEVIEEYCDNNSLSFAFSDTYRIGSDGAIDLANKVISACDKYDDFNYLYDNDLLIEEKIEILCREIYHASNIEYSNLALEKIEALKNNNHDKLPICVSKTQYSLSDDDKKLGNPTDYTINVNDLELYNGAEFIVVLLGKTLRIPGLPKNPNYERIKLDSDYNIQGLS